MYLLWAKTDDMEPRNFDHGLCQSTSYAKRPLTIGQRQCEHCCKQCRCVLSIQGRAYATFYKMFSFLLRAPLYNEKNKSGTYSNAHVGVHTYTYMKTLVTCQPFICQEFHSRKHEISSTKLLPLHNAIFIFCQVLRNKIKMYERKKHTGSYLKAEYMLKKKNIVAFIDYIKGKAIPVSDCFNKKETHNKSLLREYSPILCGCSILGDT